jgi:hypothetical protein
MPDYDICGTQVRTHVGLGNDLVAAINEIIVDNEAFVGTWGHVLRQT